MAGVSIAGTPMTEAGSRAAGPDKVLEGSYVDWAAILGGGVVALGVGSVFAAFGAALGLSSISARPGEGSFDVMVVVAAVWIVVSLVASYLTGGYIAGRMRRRVDKATADEVTVRDGVNGLIVWGLGMVVSVMMLGSFLSAGASAVGSAAETAGNIAGGVAEGAMSAAGTLADDGALSDAVSYASDSLLRPDVATPGTDTPEAMAAQSAAILANVAATGEITDGERAYLVSAVTAATGAQPAQAQARVDTAVTAAQQARADAEALAAEVEQTAIEVAETARVSGILTAFILSAAAMVAAAAAYVGSVRGGRHRDEGRIYGGLSYRR